MSDLTPEGTLHAESCEAYGYGITVVVPLDVALAAVAAERERLEAALLTDKVADEVEATRGAAGAGDDAYNTAAMLSALRAGVALAREGFRDE